MHEITIKAQSYRGLVRQYFEFSVPAIPFIGDGGYAATSKTAYHFSGWLDILVDGVDKVVGRIDTNMIETTSSEIEGENDCRHYHCDGSLHGVSGIISQFQSQHHEYPFVERISEPWTGQTYTSCGCISNNHRQVKSFSGDDRTIRFTGVISAGPLFGNRCYYDTVIEKIVFRLNSVQADKDLRNISFDVSCTVTFGLSKLYILRQWGDYYLVDQMDSEGQSVGTGKYRIREGFDTFITRFTDETFPVFRARMYSESWNRRKAIVKDLLAKVRRDEYDYGDATLEAAQSARYVNINSLAYFKDFIEVGSLAKAVMKLEIPLEFIADLRQWRKRLLALAGETSRPGLAIDAVNAETRKRVKRLLRQTTKANLGVWLSAHYGWRLTAADTEEIASAIERLATELYEPYPTDTLSASHTSSWDTQNIHDIEVTQRCRLIVSSYTREQREFLERTQNISRILYDLDLMPSLANIWDMVPLSFVADWITPIGDAFERIEDTKYLQTLPIMRSCYSTKLTWSRIHTYSDNGWNFEGNLYYSYYERTCLLGSCIPPKYRPPELRLFRPIHWLELSAIIFGD